MEVAPNSGLMLEIVARSGERQAGEAVPGELDERADHAEPAQHLGDHEHEVGRRRRQRQLAGEAHADDPRHRLVQRLAQEDGLGLDPADAVAEHAEPVDHRRVGVGPDQRVRVGDPAGLVLAVRDDRREVLEVDLVDDPGAGRHDAQVAERGLRPAQELVPLAVALVLLADVERERALAAPGVDLDRVVDDEVRGHERVDLRRVAAERRHRVAHRREVDHGGDAGEVLEDDPAGHERHLGLARAARPPGGERVDVVLADDAAAGVAERVLEQDLEGDRGATEVGAEGHGATGERVEPVQVGEAGAEGCSGAKGIGRGHGLISIVEIGR